MSLTGVYALDATHFDNVYGPEERVHIASLVEVLAPPMTRDELLARAELLARLEVLLTGWGAPALDAAFLRRTPKLRAVFYGAGSVKPIVSDALFERGVVLTTANTALAKPVAEYTVAQVILCLKRVWQTAQDTRLRRGHPPRVAGPGAFGSTIGIVSLGAIGRLVLRKLQAMDVRVVAYDPCLSGPEAAALGVPLCSLEELFARSDVVTLHTPWLPETENLVGGRHFRAMKPGASFINTARGAVVNEPEMVAVLRARPDLFAVLDVTWPEPPPADSPLYDLPNVVVTPHIAGAMGLECRRMGRMMAEELERFVRGEPLQGQVRRERLATMA
jgi:phosphoglycerate dehydrogenase-like enzyme